MRIYARGRGSALFEHVFRSTAAAGATELLPGRKAAQKIAWLALSNALN
jgi:hypothetical protein